MSSQYTSKATLYSGCPFTQGDMNTLYPSSLQSKKAWMDQLTHRSFDNIMIPRYDSASGNFDLDLTCNNTFAASVNYCFVEDNRGKSYFAYVFGCRYINDSTRQGESMWRFHCVIDPLMTYLVDNSQFCDTQLIRHTTNGRDSYNNQIPEEMPFATGNVFQHDATDTAALGVDLNAVHVLVLYVPNNNAVYSCRLGRVPSALAGVVYPLDANIENQINNFATSLTDPDQLKGIFLVPDVGFNNPGGIPDPMYPDAGQFMTQERSVEVYNYDARRIINGYEVRYAKTAFYPYHYASIYTNSGNRVDLKFEKWQTNGNAKFCIGIDTVAVPPVVIKCGPEGYDEDGVGGASGYTIAGRNYCRSVEVTGYPTTSWKIDNWYAYYSQHKASVAMQYVSGFIGAASSVLPVFAGGSYTPASESFVHTPNASGAGIGQTQHIKTPASFTSEGTPNIGGMISAITKPLEMGANAVDMKNQADTLYGTTTPGECDFQTYNMNIKIAQYSVSNSVLEKIDAYFDRYGYNQGGKIGKISANGAARYTYASAKGTAVMPGSSGANQSEMAYINNAFAVGVTMWNTTNSTGGINVFGDPFA